MSQTNETTKRKKRKKRMRLPNGLGSVHLIGDGKQRRNPWRARVPAHVEMDPVKGTAVQKYITVGYIATEIDAINALMEYRKSPYTLEAATATFEDVVEAWKEKKYQKLSPASQSYYNSAFKNCEALHKMKIRDIRTSHLEEIMNTIEGGYGVQSRLKIYWGMIFKYALEHDFVTKNYADFVKTRDKDHGTTRTDISAEHRKIFWKEALAGDHAAQLVCIYMYTGMRPSELVEIEKADVDLENRIMIGGIKTEASKNRRIPLHKDILPFIERLMATEGDALMTWKTATGKVKKYSYMRYFKNDWNPLVERLGLTEAGYTPHYTRHTCATMLREAKVEEDIRKAILGHKSKDVTDRYTHLSDAMLLEAIDLLPGP